MMPACEKTTCEFLGVATFTETSIDVVFIEDKHKRGYTGYIRGIPELTVQGSTKRKVIRLLLISLKTIFLSQLK